MTSKTRTRLKVGVIGVGRLGKVYVRDLAARIPETTVVAVADTDRALAGKIAEEFDVPKAYGSADELIGDRNVDAVVVVTPTHTHREIVVAAAQAGKPTFCEKPPALSLAECAAMSDAVEQVGIVFSDGLHAPLRSRIRGGEGKDFPGRDREAGGLQIDVARSVPSEPRVRESGEQRRHHGRHGHSRFRPCALVHGRRRDGLGGGCRARLSGNGVDRRYRQRDCDARVRRWAARRDRSDAQRRLRVRHHDRTARGRRHAARRIPS